MMTTPSGVVVHAVEAAAHLGGPEREAELLLDAGGPPSRRFLLMIEARQGLHTGALALLLVLARQEALVAPGVVERAQHVLERGEVARRPAPQVELDGGVERAAVDHGVVLPERDAQDVHVVVLERTGLVVVHLVVAHHDLGARRERHRLATTRRRRGRVALELLDRLRAEGARRPSAGGRGPRARTGSPSSRAWSPCSRRS